MLATEEASNLPSNIPMQVLHTVKQVWADKIIQSRVKTFVWRHLRLALGTACRTHNIISDIEKNYSRCGRPKDDKIFSLIAALLERYGSLHL